MCIGKSKKNDTYIFNNIFVRSSRPEVFCKKGVVENCANFTGKHLCWSRQQWSFPVNFAKLLRTPFFNRTASVAASAPWKVTSGKKRLEVCIPAGIYLFKVNNKKTRTRCEIYSKLKEKTPERRHWPHSGVFIVNFEHVISGWVEDSISPFLTDFMFYIFRFTGIFRKYKMRTLTRYRLIEFLKSCPKNMQRDDSFSMHAKFFEKLTFLTPWYVRVRIRR